MPKQYHDVIDPDRQGWIDRLTRQPRNMFTFHAAGDLAVIRQVRADGTTHDLARCRTSDAREVCGRSNECGAFVDCGLCF